MSVQPRLTQLNHHFHDIIPVVRQNFFCGVGTQPLGTQYLDSKTATATRWMRSLQTAIAIVTGRYFTAPPVLRPSCWEWIEELIYENEDLTDDISLG